MAEVNTEENVNIKEKVSAVRELVPGKSTNEIVLVLQFYDYSVERAIQAYLEDGAKEALTEWHFTGSKPANKKKKNKKAKVAANQPNIQPSLSTSNNKKESVPNHTKEPITNGDVHEDEELLRVRARLLDGEPSLQRYTASASEAAGATADPTPVPTQVPTPVSVPADPSPTPEVDRGNSPPGAEAHPHYNKHQHKHSDKHSGPHHHGNLHAYQRQRTSSERSTSSVGNQAVKKPFAGLEKSTKDLQRQTISLERLRLGLDSEIDKAYRRVKAVFEDARNSFLDREVQLIREVDALKVQANEVFKMRQEKAAELKIRVERAEKLSNTQLAELRADIKLFVSDRKIDEDLCKTTRFTYDSDRFTEEVKSFGTVVPVKCPYSTRRPSVSSVASSGHGQDEPISPSLRPHAAVTYPMHTDVDSANPDNNLSMAEMAELQQRLKNSLQLQQKPSKSKGLPVKSPPPRNRPASAPAQKPEGDQDDDFRRNKPGRRRRGPREYSHNENTDRPNENHSNQSQPAQSRSPSGTSPEKTSTTDRPNTGNRSPRRNYSGNQSSPRRYGSGGGRGRVGRGRGGDGYPDDSGNRGEDRRPRNYGEGQGRGGRGREWRSRDGRGRGRGGGGGGRGGGYSNPRPNAQSSQGGSTSSSGNPAVVNGPTSNSGN